jgi:hypothetical protein
LTECYFWLYKQNGFANFETGLSASVYHFENLSQLKIYFEYANKIVLQKISQTITLCEYMENAKFFTMIFSSRVQLRVKEKLFE